MSLRTLFPVLIIGSTLVASGSAGAQPYYERPYGWRDGYPPRERMIEEYPGPRYRARAYPRGGWDCNEYRCIEISTGAVWESTCNYQGCFPLKPSSRYRGYPRW